MMTVLPVGVSVTFTISATTDVGPRDSKKLVGGGQSLGGPSKMRAEAPRFRPQAFVLSPTTPFLHLTHEKKAISKFC